MGSTQLIDGLAPGQVRQFSYQACYFKRLWADAWTWVPYVRCVTAEEQAAPALAAIINPAINAMR